MKEISRKKRMRNGLLFSIIVLFALIFRVGWIQFVNGGELQTLAYEQQTLDRKINPKRGTIYDRNKNELAVSSTVYTITITPTNIEEENTITKTIRIKRNVANKLESLAVQNNITFNRLVNECIDFALENMEEDTKIEVSVQNN